MNNEVIGPILRKKTRVAPVVARKGSLSLSSRSVPKLNTEEEAFLDGVTSSGQFSLRKTLGMYAGVSQLRAGPDEGSS
jgi:hypothetical protein